MGNHGNNPKPGSHTKVGPFTLEQMMMIFNYLEGQPRNQAIFAVGVSTNLRASDILKITVLETRMALKRGYLMVWEEKTKNFRQITITNDLRGALERLLAIIGEPTKEDATKFIFANPYTGEQLTTETLNRLVKKWADWLGIKDHNYGSHSLRKTWGFLQRTILKTEIPLLMSMYGHSTQRQTLEYLCIQEEEKVEAYNAFDGLLSGRKLAA